MTLAPLMNTGQVPLTSTPLEADHTSRNFARLIPRTAGFDEEGLIFARDASRSTLTRRKQYMTSLVADNKVRGQTHHHHSPNSGAKTATSSNYVIPTVTDNLSAPSSSSSSPSSSPSSSKYFRHTAGMLSHPTTAAPSPGSLRRSGDSPHTRLSHGSSPGVMGPVNPNMHPRRRQLDSASSSVSNSPSSQRSSNPPTRHTSQQPQPPVTPQTYEKAMWDLVFRKFCQEEVIFSGLKEQLLSRVHRNSAYAHPNELTRNLMTVGRAIRSVSLDLPAIAQWNLPRLAREKDMAILDRLFLINLRIMVYDPAHDIVCSNPVCANPLCHFVHSPTYNTQDRASAFGCCLNLLLNDGMHHRLIDRDNKMSVRLTAMSSAQTPQQRVRYLRQIATLLLLSRQTGISEIALRGIDRLHYLAKDSSSETVNQVNMYHYANARARLYETPNPWLVHDLKGIDSKAIARLARMSISTPFLRAVYRLTPHDLDVDDMVYFSLLKCGQIQLDYWDQATQLTCPMLLHLFMSVPGKKLMDFMYQENLPQLRPLFTRKVTERQRLAPLDRIQEKVLARAHALGLLAIYQKGGDTLGNHLPDTDDTALLSKVHGYCMHLSIEFAHLLSRMMFIRSSERQGEIQFQPYFTDGYVIDEAGPATPTPWVEVFNKFMRAENIQRRVPPMLLTAYMAVASDLLYQRDTVCDLELFLELVLALLTEFRKRRPDYEVVVTTPGGALVESPKDSSVLPQWDRLVREEIGGEFDRLYAEASRYMTQCIELRSRCAAPDPSRTPSSTSISSASTVRPPSHSESSKHTILLSPTTSLPPPTALISPNQSSFTSMGSAASAESSPLPNQLPVFPPIRPTSST
ncbi:hypothetical protein IWQ61_006478 [Dispira simplex]|nr:hypothetical protein IWQ61_006478 [Dispira simplex]